MAHKQKLAHPAFIIAVFTLFLNDWYLKQAYGNVITGKLSDIAGLFAFPFFFAALFPRFRRGIYLATFFGFLFWKSFLVQPLIAFLNNVGLPVNRVIDYSDYVALFILPFSYYVFIKANGYFLKPVLLNLLASVTIITFGATSMPPGTYMQWDAVNKTYPFSFSKRELVSRVNTFQLEYVRKLNKYAHLNNDGLTFNSKNNTFYWYRHSMYNDKIYIDTIARILDYQAIKETDTIKLRTSYADIVILGDSINSQLKLIALRRYVRKSEKSDPMEQTIKLFEKHVIKKINRYSKGIL